MGSRFLQIGKLIINTSSEVINPKKHKTFLQSAKMVLGTFWCGFIAAHKTWKYYSQRNAVTGGNIIVQKR